MITVKMINKGMITIPAKLRKKFGFKNGTEFFLDIDEKGSIQLIPVIDVLEEKEWYIDPEEMIESVRNERRAEITQEHMKE